MLFENSKTFYILGLLFILIGLILINLDFNLLDYSFIRNWNSTISIRAQRSYKAYLSYFGQKNLVETV
jgi:hypothetical protein